MLYRLPINALFLTELRCRKLKIISSCLQIPERAIESRICFGEALANSGRPAVWMEPGRQAGSWRTASRRRRHRHRLGATAAAAGALAAIATHEPRDAGPGQSGSRAAQTLGADWAGIGRRAYVPPSHSVSCRRRTDGRTETVSRAFFAPLLLFLSVASPSPPK